MSVESSMRATLGRGRKLLVPYVTGGLDPEWRQTVLAVVAAGADAVEIGIPFSDPVMDGPTIQAASQQALERGATPAGIIGELRGLEAGVPLVAMTYYNLVFRAGHRRFARSLREAGVDGAIVPDIPLEELEEWGRAAADSAIETILLASPLTPDDRLARLCRRTQGFLYAVSRLGVTGEQSAVASSAAVLTKRIKMITDKPVLVGFGVSTPAQAVEVCVEADGVIVASALIRRLLDGGGPDDAAEFVAGMRSALDDAYG